MLKTIFRSAFSLVFPLNCELCGRFLASHEHGPVCTVCKRRVVLIAPPHCTGCGRTTFDDTELCGNCLGEKFYFDRAYSSVLYGSDMKELVHRFKFGGKRFLAPFFCETMEKFALLYLKTIPWDTIVPVPMTRKREGERGFNQARVLSGRLAGKFAKPHAPRALRCLASEKSQAALGRSERKTNAEGRFFVKDRSAVEQRDILLIDDILTTGQTGSACAKALKDAGANSVTLFTFARGA